MVKVLAVVKARLTDRASRVLKIHTLDIIS